MRLMHEVTVDKTADALISSQSRLNFGIEWIRRTKLHGLFA
jgi:hypothetical protein